MTDINTNGTSLRGHFQMPYAKLVKFIGEPNAMSDGYKTDVEWAFKRDGLVATIYNWKNGPNYTGCGNIEDIDEWNIGGHDYLAIQVVMNLLSSGQNWHRDYENLISVTGANAKKAQQ